MHYAGLLLDSLCTCCGFRGHALRAPCLATGLSLAMGILEKMETTGVIGVLTTIVHWGHIGYRLR